MQIEKRKGVFAFKDEVGTLEDTHTEVMELSTNSLAVCVFSHGDPFTYAATCGDVSIRPTGTVIAAMMVPHGNCSGESGDLLRFAFNGMNTTDYNSQMNTSITT
ncbi:hypothetical protein RUM44_009394 [Polyplax serrata]|uniref:Uncharacterized protein n=1 Tax=Polyplax serrata TaxID=468196 RepID=A0ABR1ASJ9_POLSC